MILLHSTVQNSIEIVMQLDLNTNAQLDIPKYQQLVNAVNNAIANNILSKGDPLPSVNKVCKQFNLSKDTVFKSYQILKEQKIIDSVPSKGYFVAHSNKKVLLVLDTFKAYKEVLYHSFVNNLSKEIKVDVQFHHYNINNFRTIINNGLGNYYKYIVMNFNHKEVPKTIAAIPKDNLLLIDWNIHANKEKNYIFQDFGLSFYNALEKDKSVIKKYKKVSFLYPTFTEHPLETVTFCEQFCTENKILFEVIESKSQFNVEANVLYICVSDRMLGEFLKQCKLKNLEPGKDVGILSYNETPMKQFIYKGISVVSTDFEQMGIKAASFVNSNQSMQQYIPTSIILRNSI